MTDNVYQRSPDESVEEYLWRVGTMKECGLINKNWRDLTEILNDQTDSAGTDESTWRKRFKKMLAATNKQSDAFTNDNINNNASEIEDLLNQKIALDMAKVQVRDERYAIGRMIRREARADVLLDLFKDSIRKYEPKPVLATPSVDVSVDSDTRSAAVYAMLSDIHYGITFESRVGIYNSDIASERVMKYAKRIVEIGKMNHADTCYVSLMGDMVSGIIHHTIRIENRENVIDQVIGVSELTAAFLYELSNHFNTVYVNSVSGNHSRLDLNAEEALRGEKLDALIPWYCKTKLSNLSNVVFLENEIDPTIASYKIFDKLFVAVHGDYDKDMKRTATSIQLMLGEHIDYVLAGHMHIADMRIEGTGYIRNGAVCGSGDEYTMKNRLYGPPCQVCMIVTPDGVESVYPVLLS